jgi:hypothetical protein
VFDPARAHESIGILCWREALGIENEDLGTSARSDGLLDRPRDRFASWSVTVERESQPLDAELGQALEGLRCNPDASNSGYRWEAAGAQMVHVEEPFDENEVAVTIPPAPRLTDSAC